MPSTVLQRIGAVVIFPFNLAFYVLFSPFRFIRDFWYKPNLKIEAKKQKPQENASSSESEEEDEKETDAADLKKSKLRLESELKSTKEELEKLRKQIASKEHLEEELKNQKNELKAQLSNVEQTKANVAKDKEKLEAARKTLEEERRKDVEARRKLESHEQSLNKELSKLETEKKRLESEKSKRAGDLLFQSSMGETQKTQQQRVELEIKHLKDDIQQLQDQLTEQKDRNQKAEQTFLSQKQKMEAEISKLNEDLKTAQKTAERNKTEAESHSSKIASLSKQNKELESKAAQHQNELNTLKDNKLKELQQLQQDLQKQVTEVERLKKENAELSSKLSLLQQTATELPPSSSNVEAEKASLMRSLKQSNISSSPFSKEAADSREPPEKMKAIVTLQTRIRGYHAKNLFKSASKFDFLCMKWISDIWCAERRRDIVQEVLKTEESYVASLETLVKVQTADCSLHWFFFEVWLKPLTLIARNPDAFITEKDLNSIFSTVEEIQKNNAALLQVMKQRLAKWNYQTKFGDIFVNKVTELWL